jgi:hypothetical protein
MRKILATLLIATTLAGCQTAAYHTTYVPPPRVVYTQPVYRPEPVKVCRMEQVWNPVYRAWVREERCRIVYR